MATIVDTLRCCPMRSHAHLSITTLFRVYEDLDKNEGRGGSTLRFTVGNENDANTLAEGLGPMGTSGRIERAEYMCVVFEGGKNVLHVPVAALIEGDIPATAKAAVAARALRKLTAEERAALGLG